MKPSNEENQTGGFPVVCIGISSGGITPLRTLFRGISPNTGMAFIIIHHLRNTQTTLPQILSSCTSMPVRLARGGDLIRPNHVFVLPTGSQMTVADGHFSVRSRSKLWGFSNVLTVCLESLAKSTHPGIAVILSGLDGDGAAALKIFSDNHGTTIIQDPRTAERPEMPTAALGTGCVQYVLPPHEIAGQLEKLALELTCGGDRRGRGVAKAAAS